MSIRTQDELQTQIKSLLKFEWADGWLGKDQKVAIDRIVFEDALNAYQSKPNYATWPIKGCLELTGTLGIQDTSQEQRGKFTITVDGTVVLQGSISKGTHKKISVDLEGAKSLSIEMFSCSLAEPRVEFGSVTSKSKVRLKVPEDGASLSGSATFKWSSVDEAISYALEVVCVQCNEADESDLPRIYSYYVKSGKTEADLDISKYPPGRYKWSVLAFGKKRMLGSFSPEKYFIIK